MSGKISLKGQLRRERGRVVFWSELLAALAADDGSALGIVQGKLAKAEGRLEELVREQAKKDAEVTLADIPPSFPACQPGAWGSPDRCLVHEGLPLGPDGRCAESPVGRHAS
jgi:hypothetical protein